ncbi:MULTISPECIES: CBS domain-containing protein [Actinomadura]|uniref:CBS domain-containing protein n=1 Tax=Actinomadura madurae TaxID=1993 RepID=A0A1I5CRT8_9ACTN|nr:CBS domain-containing protein [Actinomadura madurae]MCP9950372.1 CBS domain-containing protein [Actinomadura madurae]MCP9979619.1 CBS domain-containing protein [Actinomadura madurae]MCQ0008852.1 CBS domain-containing protein [Actinomadura madurae]URM95927.1 CBS domain-containing protein [Actinomadura madurae]URN06623.1 CBS domain-containing protein [Actinomadura madurae]
MATKVRDIMTGSPTSVSPELDLVTVARAMRDEDIGAVLVADGDHLKGVVTDRDLVIRGLAAGGDPAAVKIGGIASSVTATVGPDDSLERAAQIMRERAVRRLPVIEDGRPVGIVSIGDLAMEKDSGSALADISAARPNV